jgi:hypothetical protein
MEPEAADRQFYRALSTADAGLLDEIPADDWEGDWEDIPLNPGTVPSRESFKGQGRAWVRAVLPDFTDTKEEAIVSAAA